MVLAWLITLPMAAVVGALSWFLADLVGGVAGALLVFVLLVVAAGFMYLRARLAPVDHSNVNDDWEPDRAASSTAASNA